MYRSVYANSVISLKSVYPIMILHVGSFVVRSDSVNNNNNNSVS